jgi:hypothetical protein
MKLSRLDLRSRNLRDMQKLCDLDMAALSSDRLGLTLAATARSCFYCRHAEKCRQWLDAAKPAGNREPPRFCPNFERFRNAQAH